MNRIKTILLTLAALAAGTSATRADDLSDLVAAVAASVDTVRFVKDVMTPAFDTNQVYQSKGKGLDFDVSLLDGILRSMMHQSHRHTATFRDNGSVSSIDQDYFRPTLGRIGFFRPVPGIITSMFGWRPQFHRIHHGIDLALQIGDTVRAAVSGTVELISYDHDGYGNYVTVTHPDGMETLYGHLQYPLVVQGQYVYSGQPIGIGGNTGNSTGPHLHFETRLGGIAVDPMLLFDFYGGVQTFNSTSSASTPKTPTYSHQAKSLKKESTYIVRVGDTPESVARQAGISVMRLCQLNLLKQTDPLPMGRMLKLK